MLLKMSLQLFFRLKRLTLVVNSRDYHPLDSSKDPFCKFLREAVALNRSIERSKLRCCYKTDALDSYNKRKETSFLAESRSEFLKKDPEISKTEQFFIYKVNKK